MAAVNVKATKITVNPVEESPGTFSATIKIYDVTNLQWLDDYVVGDVQDIASGEDLLPSGRGGDEWVWV